MKKTVILAIIILIFILLVAPLSIAGPSKRQKIGFIQNIDGVKCEYYQTFQQNNRYFHKTITSNTGMINFIDKTCMAATGMALDVNVMLINNTIAKWYSRPDAKFQTKAADLRHGSALQTKGKCIQSEKYPLVGITVEYFTLDDSIFQVIHGSSVQGCID